MKLKEYQEMIHDNGQTFQDLSESETIEAIGIIADDIIQGCATITHANALFGIRYSLMNIAEQKAEYNQISRSAQVLGSIKSERKAAASRINGRLGGRPRKK